jgi:hypothetical protein
MPAPTRTQIEADVALPVIQVILDGVDVTAHVLDVEGDLAQTAGGDGVGFGAVVQPSATIRIDRAAFSLAWEERPIEIRYGFADSDKVLYFRGVVTGQERGLAEGSWTMRGFDALIDSTEIRSLVVQDRPIATRTTSGSAENPDGPDYAAGIINEIFWRAGGRPLEQATTYPDAAFSYSCQTAVLSPRYSWANGENGWELLGTLCRAAGGVVYQDSTGVMRYVEPFSLGDGTPTHHFTDEPLTAAQRVSQGKSHYADIRRQASTEIAVGAVRSPFVARAADLPQEVYASKEPIPLAPGQSVTVTLELTHPCLRLDGVTIKAALAQRARAATTSEVTVSGVQLVAGQRAVATLANTTAERATVYEVAATGVPLLAGEQGDARYSAIVARPRGRDLELEDSPYIQSRAFAERRARMFWDFYAEPRPVVTLSGCGFDPDRQLGAIVLLTCSAWGMSAVRHRIVALRPSRAGALMDVDLVPVAGLPFRGDYLVTDQTYDSNAVLLRLAY